MTGTVRVLIVDDNEFNMELAAALVEREGWEVLSASDAKQAIEIANAEMPSLILMDIGLPGVDGLTAIRCLKEDPLTREIPVVAMTAHVLIERQAEILAAGPDGFLAKPIDRYQMRTLLHRLLGLKM